MPAADPISQLSRLPACGFILDDYYGPLKLVPLGDPTGPTIQFKIDISLFNGRAPKLNKKIVHEVVYRPDVLLYQSYDTHDAAFATETLAEIERANRMPDGNPGLLIFGRQRAFEFIQKAPDALRAFMIERLLRKDDGETLLTEKCLIAKTEGIRGSLWLALEPSGRLSAASLNDSSCSVWLDSIKEFASETRFFGGNFKLEHQADTSLDFAALANAGPEQAGALLKRAFWDEIVPALADPLIPSHGHHYKPVVQRPWWGGEMVDDPDLTCSMGTAQELRESLNDVLFVAQTSGRLEAVIQAIGARGRDEFDVGIVCGSPIDSPHFYPSDLFPDAAIEEILREIAFAAMPISRALNCDEDASGRMSLIDHRGHYDPGNRISEMPFRPTIIFQDITQLVDTSAHAVIGARANLLSYMTEKLGIGAAHAEALIVGIETPP